METQSTMNETNQARKFLFDLSFDQEAQLMSDDRTKAKVKTNYSQEQLDQAKQAAYEEGVRAGQKAMMEDQQQFMNVLLTQIDQKLSHVIADSLNEWQRQLAQLQEIALVIARKVLPHYAEKYGLDEIEAIIIKVMAEVAHEPRLVFRVNEEQFDEASTRINTIAEQAAYAGKIVILADPEISKSDCRVEWADGGIERDLKKMWRDIDRVMEEVQTFELGVIESTEAAAKKQEATIMAKVASPKVEQPKAEPPVIEVSQNIEMNEVEAKENLALQPEAMTEPPTPITTAPDLGEEK